MRLKYLLSSVILVLLASSTNAEEKDAWSWGEEALLDPKAPLPLETHPESPTRTAKDLSSDSPKENLEIVVEEESSPDSASVQFGESGALASEDINTSLEEEGGDRTGRFLGLGDKLCFMGIGSNCKKNYQPAVQSHYGAPVKTLAPSGNYGPPPTPLRPSGNYGPPPTPLRPAGNYGPPSAPHRPVGTYGPPPFPAPSAPVGNYGPPPVTGYAPPVKKGTYKGHATKAPKGFLGSISDAVSSLLYKKTDDKAVAPYDAPKTEYYAPKPAYNPPKASYSAHESTLPKASYNNPKPAYVTVQPTYTAPKSAYNPPKAVYSAPNPAYVAVQPAYTAPNPAYNPPKPSYSAPKPAYSPPKPAYYAPKPAYSPPKPAYSAPKPAYSPPKLAYSAPKPAYSPLKPAYSAPRPAYNPPKATYNVPKPAYTAPKGTYVAQHHNPSYTAPKASYSSPAHKPAYTAPKATYVSPFHKPTYKAPKAAYVAPATKPAYTASKAAYVAPVPKPAYSAPKATYSAPIPKPAYTAPKATYSAPAPKPAYTAHRATYAAPAPKPAYSAPKAIYAAPKVGHQAHNPSFVAPTQVYAVTKPIINTRLPTVTVAQAQPVVHHVHTHTHVYQGAQSVETVRQAAAPATITATPVVVSVPSVVYAKQADFLIPSGSEQSIYVQSGTVVQLNEVKSYEEDCQCVRASQCPVGNIIHEKKSSKDISHLLDARNSDIEIKSNATTVNETTSDDGSKRKRRNTDEEVTEESHDEEITEESNNEEAFTDRQGRQLKGFTPGMSGCSLGYVCCRRPVYNPPKPKQAFVERKPTVTVLSSSLGTTRPLNVVHQSKSQSTNAISNHRNPGLKSHFAVKGNSQNIPKVNAPTITSSSLPQKGLAYNEDCHCIPENHCPASDVVPRNSQKDISHLLDARNKNVEILSTVTDSERVRRSTDNTTSETSDNSTENNNSTDRQGRQLLGVTPGSFGCRQGYACCRRRPVFNANKPKQINTTPFNAIANTAAIPQQPRPVNSISIPSKTQPRPEVVIRQSTRTQAVISPYNEDCHCIARNFCRANNIVLRNSPRDISHLLDARNKNSTILSTASEERVRRSTNESSSVSSDSNVSARQSRQLQGYTPGRAGCGVDDVCCRRPVYAPTRTQKAINKPTRKTIRVRSRPQVQRVPQLVAVSSHTPKPVVLIAQQSLLQHAVPAYREQCTCVAPNFCQQTNVIARNSPSDISHLLDARNSGTKITSNDTEMTSDTTETRSRRSTIEETESANNETLYSDIQGRQVKSFPPGVGGCHAGTVCCRQPDFSVQNAISSVHRPSVISQQNVRVQNAVPTVSRPSVAGRPNFNVRNTVPTVSRPSVTAQTVNVIQPRSKYTCGKSNSQSLLGRVKTPHFEQGDAEFGEYPWQAAILKMAEGDAQYVCGAALIDGQHLLTAAHCIDGIQAYNLKIRLGEWDVAGESEFFSHIQVQVADVYIHKDYYKGNLQNDIAVMKLTAPVDFTSNPHITPVCLPGPTSDFRGQQCTVTGWGKDAFGSEGKFQKILKEVSVPVVDSRQCQNTLRTTRLGHSYSLDQGMICAGGEEGKDACKGDGGSPLVCKGSDGAYQLTGLVSWGIGCGDRGIPGVYVNIQHYLTWINAIQNA